MYSFLERLNPMVKLYLHCISISFSIGRVTNNEHYKYIDMALCKLRNPWAGFFTAGWYFLYVFTLIDRGDIDLVDKLDAGLMQLKKETEDGILPPSLDVTCVSLFIIIDASLSSRNCRR